MRTIILYIFMFSSLLSFAQKYDSSNSMSRIGLVYYVQDENGFFHKKENVNLSIVMDPISTYAYDKKSQELYMITNNANCVVRLNDNLAKFFKKSKSIPQLKEKELEKAISEQNADLEGKYQRINKARQKHINDSIQRWKEDSIKKFREDSIKADNKKRKEIEYRKNHEWDWVPTAKNSLYCILCEKYITTRDSSVCYAIKNDSIYWAEVMEGDLDLTYLHIHTAELTKKLKENARFKYHTEIFKDSLENCIPIMSKSFAAYKSYLYYEEYLDKLKKKAPNGYFLDWGWDKEYSSISFNFRFLNTNKKTLKYIDVYWVLKNDVGDIRKSGKFSGTGPLAEWESASWNWDHSSYYVSGDASKMSLSKVVITYMDGSKITLPYAKIMVN